MPLGAYLLCNWCVTGVVQLMTAFVPCAPMVTPMAAFPTRVWGQSLMQLPKVALAFLEL